MNIIRDAEQDGMNTPAISMIPIFVSWGIRRCNIVDCKNNPTTIITNIPDVPGISALGMCEHHYQEAVNTKGNYKFNAEFFK